MPTYTLSRQFKNGNEVFSQDKEVTEEGAHVLDVPIPAESTDKQVSFALDASQLKLLHMQSARDLTIEVNSGSDPDLTFTLKAGEPLQWTEGCGLPNPFITRAVVEGEIVETLVDATDLYVTLAAGADTTLVIRTLYDATP